MKTYKMDIATNDKYFEIMDSVSDKFKKNNYNTLALNEILNNLELIKRVNKTMNKLRLELKEGDAFSYNNKNYIAKMVYVSFDEVKKFVYISGVDTCCGEKIKLDVDSKIKKLK